MLDTPSDAQKRLALTDLGIDLWRTDAAHLRAAAEAAGLSGLVDSHTINEAGETLTAITNELSRLEHLGADTDGLLNGETLQMTQELEELAASVEESLRGLQGAT